MSNEKKTPDVSARKVIKLSAPMKFEDIEKTELVLDLDGLTGDDLATAEAEMQTAGVIPVFADTSKRYLMYVAARAAGVPVEFIKRMKAPDVAKVTLEVQNFLIS
jgi:hypothetical protein